MKRSEGQNRGRPTQFKFRKKVTTMRLPEDVLEYLKDKHGIIQRAIDALVIVPTLREMSEVAADLARDQEAELQALINATWPDLDAEDDKHNGGSGDT